MLKVVVIGSGNVAQHVIIAFKKAVGMELVQVFARDKNSLSHLLYTDVITSDYSQLITADLYIIAVSDYAIVDVSSRLQLADKLVVHTSGSVAMEALNDKNRKGVFYPLQTFSKNKDIDFNKVPICLEAQNTTDLELLKKVARTISENVYEIDSNQRKSLHVAAVFVSNFVNYMYQIGSEICTQNEVPFEILKPLIIETANKVMTLSPTEAQTGPAKRDDTQTINSHLNFLSDENQKEIYKLLTKSIIDNGKKL